MENRSVDIPPTKYLHLKKSFKLAARSLLTACTQEEFCNAFPKFARADQEYLHRLFVQVVTSLYGNIEDDFESLCEATQVGLALGTVEQFVEEQGLDPLFSTETNITDIGQNLSLAKKNEIQYLTCLLEKVEENNRLNRARVELLKKSMQDMSRMMEVVDKMRERSECYAIQRNDDADSVL